MPISNINKPTISQIIMMGDSLSDRGTMVERKLFGIIPIKLLLGLAGRSPRGRFTNGYAWSDMFSTNLVNELIIDSLKKQNKDATDIADDIIHQKNSLHQELKHNYTLTQDKKVNYKGKPFIRTYTEGGLTSHSYRYQLSTSIARFFSRLILATLEDKRQLVQQDDLILKISPEEKLETLIIEWSGGNDLITVNREPSFKEADDAVKARIKNIERMIDQGYRHFILMNLPDLTTTPRYRKKSKEENLLAKGVIEYFNEQLKIACNELLLKNPHCKIRLFDIDSQFKDVYHHPEKYHIDPDKRDIPYYESKDFKPSKNGKPNPASGYMFSDDIHPSGDMHSLMATRFYDYFSNKYELEASGRSEKKSTPKHTLDDSVLLFAFKRPSYQSIFSSKSGLNIPNNLPKLSKADIVKDKATFAIETKPHWIDNKHGFFVVNNQLSKDEGSKVKIDPGIHIN